MAPQPSVALTYDPPGTQFPISEQCQMPAITVTASLQNITPDPKVPLQFQWKVTLASNGQGCVHSLGRVIRHPDISQTTSSNKFRIPFSLIRGGDLVVNVTVRVGTATLTAQSKGLQVTGTNPTVGSLQAATASGTDGFKKLMRLESGLRQFLSPTCPLFSADDAGGVGLCQLTSPAPSDDQIWSWKENVKGGLALYQGKQTVAGNYPAHVRNSPEFKALVKAYNDQRAAAVKPPVPAVPPASPPKPPAPPPKPVPVDLPEYTAEQLERDTLRGFNGYAGGLHEYRVKVDANGLLVVTLDPTGATGKAEWEIITAAQRTAYYEQIGLEKKKRGDPNYVDDVEKQAGF